MVGGRTAGGRRSDRSTTMTAARSMRSARRWPETSALPRSEAW